MREYRCSHSGLQKPGCDAQSLEENRTQAQHAELAEVESSGGRGLKSLSSIVLMLYDSSVSVCVLVPEPKATDGRSEHAKPKFLLEHFNFFLSRN